MAARDMNWISTEDQQKVSDQQSVRFYLPVPAYNTTHKVSLSEFSSLFDNAKVQNSRFVKLAQQLDHIDPLVIAVIEETSPFGPSQYPNQHLVAVGNHIFITNNSLLEWAENGIDAESDCLLCTLLLKAENVVERIIH